MFVQTGQLRSFLMADDGRQVTLEILDKSGHRHVKCTHQTLAELTGLNRVTVTRALHKLEENGWISTGYGYVELKEEEKLKRFRAALE